MESITDFIFYVKYRRFISIFGIFYTRNWISKFIACYSSATYIGANLYVRLLPQFSRMDIEYDNIATPRQRSNTLKSSGKIASILALALCSLLLTFPLHFNTAAMKNPMICDAAVFYLELLATRIWLKHAGTGDLPDIPKFIARDRLCSRAESVDNKFEWSTICVPARADITFADGNPYIIVQLAAGVDGLDILYSMRNIVTARYLGDYIITQDISHNIGRVINRLILRNPSLQQPFTDGLLSTDGKTFPTLDNLFASKGENAGEILDVMRKIIFADFESDTESEGRTILRFFPASSLITN